jgi:hypothetical protein
MEDPAKISARKNQAERAYTFFRRAEQTQQHFTPVELAEATGYTLTTVKIYLSKKWWWFVRKSQGGYIVQGISRCSLAEFLRDLSQKIREPPAELPVSSPAADLCWQQKPPSLPLAMAFIFLCMLWAVLLLFLRKRSWWIIPM